MKKFSPNPRTAYDNLLDQLEKAQKSMRKSFKTRRDYALHTKQFLKFCDKYFHTQKFANVSGKHLRAFTDFLKKEGYSPSTIKSYVSGIRHMYELANGKYRLPDNTELGLEKRRLNVYNYAWFPSEYKEALELSLKQKRLDVFYSLKIGYHFGLRIEEICRVRVEAVKEAIRSGELKVKGKGGQTRFIPAYTEQQKRLLADLLRKAARDKLIDDDYVISRKGKNGVKYQIDTLENWMQTHRKKFTVINRTVFVKPGEKERPHSLRWHGLRYSFAQRYYKHMVESGCSDPKRRTSEVLGHHRSDIK